MIHSLQFEIPREQNGKITVKSYLGRVRPKDVRKSEKSVT